tara:strand:+ start:612 stop:833 length:222 start_codon:yes stop_codon:yes gene_type:complete
MEQFTDQELVVLTTLANASDEAMKCFLNTLGKGQFYIETLPLWRKLRDECNNRAIDYASGTKTVPTINLFEGA